MFQPKRESLKLKRAEQAFEDTQLVLCKFNFWYNFGVKDPIIDDRKLIHIAFNMDQLTKPFGRRF
jgi:hypothetical protein